MNCCATQQNWQRDFCLGSIAVRATATLNLGTSGALG
jgi:hypothetical protein